MANTYRQSVEEGLTAYDGTVVMDVQQFATRYVLTLKTYSDFTGGQILIEVLPSYSDTYMTLVDHNGTPSHFHMNNPTLKIIEGMNIQKVRFTPTGIDTDKSYSLIVTPMEG